MIAVVALAAGGYAVTDSRSVARDVAEFTTSGEVASARAASAAALRGGPGQPCDPDRPTLLCANADLVAAGVDPIPAPPPEANAYAISIAISRALGRLDTLVDLRARGVDLPGVTLPGPPGRFPGR